MFAPKFSTIPLLLAAYPKTDLDVAEDMHVLAPLLKVAFGVVGSKAIVTHGKDGKHSPHSRHDEGYCLDLRIWDLQFGSYRANTRPWWRACTLWAARLGRGFPEIVGPNVFLVLERDHIHLEWAGPGQVANIKGWSRDIPFYMTSDVRDLAGD